LFTAVNVAKSYSKAECRASIGFEPKHIHSILSPALNLGAK